MYEKYYGLKEKPFHIVPNSNTLYLSDKHQTALTYLEYGLMEGVGFILLTGEIGTGKTTLIRYMLKKMDQDMEVAVIFNTNVSSDQLLNLILTEYELKPANDKADGLDRLNHFLIEKYAQGRRVLLIIDEAQNLSDEALEEVRMLSNLQSDDQMLLQIMLVGQPELKRKLQDPRLTQLSQRIAVNYHLSALTREETEKYIAFRLERAGGTMSLFTTEALDLLYRTSGGIPRTINLLCDSALVYGFADELSVIDKHIVEQVLQDKGEIGFGTTQNPAGPVRTPGEGVAVDPQANSRLENLENDVNKLKIQMDWHVGELERRAEGYKDELVLKFKELLFQERKRNGKLVAEVVRLRERYDSVRKKKDESLGVSEPSFPWEDLDKGEKETRGSKRRSSIIEWLKA
jgi:general secretion pathway protein A